MDFAGREDCRKLVKFHAPKDMYWQQLSEVDSSSAAANELGLPNIMVVNINIICVECTNKCGERRRRVGVLWLAIVTGQYVAPTVNVMAKWFGTSIAGRAFIIFTC